MTRHAAQLLALALASAIGLVACGKQAELARPGPTAQAPAPSERTQAARRALQDAAATADPQAPQSYYELRSSTSLKRNRIRPGALGPSAPHPPGSPVEETPPESSAPASQ
jgi:hypothetical protein